MVNVRYLNGPGGVSVALLEMNNPPVNGMSHGLRKALMDAFDCVEAESGVRAIALIGAGKLFCGGADVREFGTAASASSPDLRELLARVFACRKPTIAVLNGAAMGGGLELAMACNYRLASEGAQLALPEVKLGLIPGAWGTQLLPRLVGVRRALEMVTRGESISAATAQDWGLLDAVATVDLDATLLDFVAAHNEDDAHPDTRRRIAADAGELHAAWLDQARVQLARDFPGCPAPLAGAEAVGLAVTLPFEQAVQRERAHFVRLMQSPESSALRYIFFAERECARIPGVRLPSATPPAGIPVAAQAPHFAEIPGAIPVDAGGTAVRIETLEKGRQGPSEWLICQLCGPDDAGPAIGLTLFRRNGVASCVEVSCPSGADSVHLAAALAIARSLSPVVVTTRADDDLRSPLQGLLVSSLETAEGAAAFSCAADAAVASGGLFRAADADVLAVHVLGYPRHNGGPLYQRALERSAQQEPRP